VVRKRKKKKYVEKEAGIFIGKTNCPSCESLDNLAVYEHEDGSHSATCFGETCRKSYVDWDYKNNKAISVERKTEYEEDDFMGVGLPTLEEVRDDRISVKLNDRKIKESVCELYGVKVELNEDGETVDRHYYPTYRKKQHVGYRIRSRFEEGDKEVEKKPKLLGVLKNFKGTIGDTKKGIELFGQHLFSPEKHKRLFITEGECFRSEDEVMTENGWVEFGKLKGNERILQVNSDYSGSLVKPLGYIKKPFEGNLVKNSSKGFTHISTPEHNMVSLDYKGRTVKNKANNRPCISNLIPRVIDFNGKGIGLSSQQIALQLAVSADSKIDKRSTKRDYAHFGFKKQRKVERLENLLEELNINFTKNIKDSYTYISFTLPEFIESKKLPDNWLITATLDERKFIIKELVNWDGNVVKDRNQFEFSNKDYEENKWVQTIAHTAGYVSTIMKRKNDFGEWFKTSILLGKKHTSWQSIVTEDNYYEGNVHCVTVPSGMLLVRIDGCITVSGNCDAMVGYQATEAGAQNIEGGYAFVSLPSGANIAGLKPQLEYINKFEEIYLCYDNDEAGKSILEKSLKILPAGKVRIMKYPKGIKDINDWWLSCKTKQERMNFPKKFYSNIWKSEKYSPAGIKSLSEGWGDYIQRGKETLIPFPASFGDMNKRTHGGYALGEILTIAAPSSVGKSSFVKEMIYTALTETDYNIGICSFEETLGEFIEGFLSVHMSEQLNEIPYDKRDRDKEWIEFNKLITMGKSDEEVEEEGSFADRVHYLDHQGSCDGDELLEKIDFLINGLDCKIIFVDPVTLALANTDMEEDEFTAVLVKKVKKENIAWVNIHHVRKNAGGSKANSEGGDMAEEDIKGSGSWFQTSMINMLLMRNKVHTNPIVRNTTTIKMSKCRRHGKNTGIAGYTFYNGDTGRLELGVNPEDYLDEDVDTDHTFDHEELPDSFVDEWHRGEES